MAKNSKLLTVIIDAVIIVVLAAAIGVSMLYTEYIEFAIGLRYYVEEEVPVDDGGVSQSADTKAGELTVAFLNVGQGDCAIIEFPDGKTMIIDASVNSNAVKTQIKTYIDENLPEDFQYFDYAILTHPDRDHYGSMAYVLENWPAYTVYRPNVEATGSTDEPYIDEGKADLSSDVVAKTGPEWAKAVSALYQAPDGFERTVLVTDPYDESQTITGGTGDDEYSFTFFSPLSTSYGTEDWNEYSPIMVLEYRGFSFVMSGDAEKKNLKEFVEKVESAKTDGVTDKYDKFDENFCANVIKAGHHGSENATTAEYLEVMTSPANVADTYSVISCGLNNSYKHPHAEALERIKNAGITDDHVLRTDLLQQHIVFNVRVDENGVYNLYYGDEGTTAPEKPDPVTPEPTPDQPVKTVLVLCYMTVGDIRITWPMVAWSGYAVITVALIIHIVITLLKKSGNGGNGSAHRPPSPSNGGRGGRR